MAKSETSWVPIESRIYSHITLKRSRLGQVSLLRSTWATKCVSPCERDALPTELYPHNQLPLNGLNHLKPTVLPGLSTPLSDADEKKMSPNKPKSQSDSREPGTSQQMMSAGGPCLALPKRNSGQRWLSKQPCWHPSGMLKSGGSLPVVSLPLHRPATGWDASGILKQTAPHRHPTPPTTCSHDTPLHGPNDEMVFRAGVGRTDTAKRSAEQGVDLACSDHTRELVWRHRNVFERECELRCRLTRRRWRTPDPSHPPKTAKSHKGSSRFSMGGVSKEGVRPRKGGCLKWRAQA
jgi:hypothetical protein